MRNVIVTGASGFIGKKLTCALVEMGYRVYALAHHFDEELQECQDIVCVDVSGKNVLEISEQLQHENFYCMFQLAWTGTSGVKRADYVTQLKNVKTTCDYVVLCNRIGCKRIVYASSINEMETYEYLQMDGIEPTGGYIYGTGKLAAHLMAETVAKLQGIEFIPAIITNIYGVGEKSARMIYTSIDKLVHKEHCSFTEGYQMYDFIYITDAINSLIAIAEKGKAFNRYYIGSGEPRPLRNFLLEMRDVVDPDAQIGLGDLKFKGKDISYEQFELKKVEEDTGYKNQISFAEGIKLTAEYIRGDAR